jgi:hypothetical protein
VQQLGESKAISARAEVDAAHIFMPSDIFGQRVYAT